MDPSVCYPSLFIVFLSKIGILCAHRRFEQIPAERFAAARLEMR